MYDASLQSEAPKSCCAEYRTPAAGRYVCKRFHAAGHCTAWRRKQRNFRRGPPRRATNVLLEGHLLPRMLKPSTSRKEPRYLCRKLIAVRRAHHLTLGVKQLAAKFPSSHASCRKAAVGERGEVKHRYDEAHRRRNRRTAVPPLEMPEHYCCCGMILHARRLVAPMLRQVPRPTDTASGATTTASTPTRPRWRRHRGSAPRLAQTPTCQFDEAVFVCWAPSCRNWSAGAPCRKTRALRRRSSEARYGDEVLSTQQTKHLLDPWTQRHGTT